MNRRRSRELDARRILLEPFDTSMSFGLSRQNARLPFVSRARIFGGCEILAPARETANPDLEIEQRIVERDQEKQGAERQEIQRRCHTHGCQRRCERMPDPTAQEEPCESERSVSNPGGLEPARPEPGLEFRHRHAVAEGRRAHVKDAAILRLETGVRVGPRRRICTRSPMNDQPRLIRRVPAQSTGPAASQPVPRNILPKKERRFSGLPAAVRRNADCQEIPS